MTTTGSTPLPLRQIYQLKITLEGIDPPVWRRILVASTTALPELHDILQRTMGWSDCHLHQFLIGDKRYGTPEPDYDDGTLDESRLRLSTLLRQAGAQMVYEYDFGDGWIHTLLLEDLLPFTPGQALPRCLAGERACPPEDVGGPWGYANFLDAWGNKTHPEHHGMVAWAGKRFDPERCDLAGINRCLARLKRAG